MRKPSILVLCIVCLLVLPSCSPRDFLTRRLAGDLIAASDTFGAPQQFQLRTGLVSNKDYLSPEYLELQHRGWISASKAPCSPALVAPPCWDITLTPSGVDTFQSLIAPADAAKQSFSIPAARRELVAITGIAKQGNSAEVEFAWKWIPMNEVGAVLYPADTRYHSTAGFRCYDDGWRLIESVSHPPESLDESLKNSAPAH
jgi:hypothetical protein